MTSWIERIQWEMATVTEEDIVKAEPEIELNENDIKLGVAPEDVKKLVVLWTRHLEKALSALDKAEKYCDSELSSDKAWAYLSIGEEEKSIARSIGVFAESELCQQLHLWHKSFSMRKGWVVVADQSDKESEDDVDEQSENDSKLIDGDDTILQ